MINNKTTLEIKIEERIYQFLCDSNCSLGEVYDVLSRMKNFVYQRIKEAQKAENPEKIEQE